MDIPERRLEYYGDHIGFKAESITGLGARVFEWKSNTTDTPENFLAVQEICLREKGIELRMGPAIDLARSLAYPRSQSPIVTDVSPEGEKGFGVYVENTRGILYVTSVEYRGKPYNGTFTPAP
jgi:hypothetical protein